MMQECADELSAHLSINQKRETEIVWDFMLEQYSKHKEMPVADILFNRKHNFTFAKTVIMYCANAIGFDADFIAQKTRMSVGSVKKQIRKHGRQIDGAVGKRGIYSVMRREAEALISAAQKLLNCLEHERNSIAAGGGGENH
ncbi:hypothetical protein [Rhodoflexus sp.]